MCIPSTQTDKYKTPSKSNHLPKSLYRQQLTRPLKSNPGIPHKIQAFQPSKIIPRGHLPQGINGGIYCEQWGIGGGFTATERSGTGGITGTEIRNGAVQKTALRLHRGALACRSEAEAQGIRPQYRTVYVRSDYPGNPGTAGKRAMHVCGSLIIHFHVFSLWSFPPLPGVHGRGSAAAQGYFVFELVTICKQLAPNLKRARMDVSYIYLYIERVPARFSATPGGYPSQGLQVDT